MHTSNTAMASATAIVLGALLAACGQPARLQVDEGSGPSPRIPEPSKSLIPTLNIAPAAPWTAGQTPVSAAGTTVSPFAQGLDHPRWLLVLPNGDVLVAETNAPPKPDDAKGLRGWIQGKVMARAGAGTPSANRITLLRDADGDGVAETRTVFLQGLNSPFGMALVGSDLYVADSDALLRFAYTPGATSLSGPGTKVVDLPAGPINHHWTKNVIASADGSRLYVTIGSNSNVGENGMAAEEGRADIWEVDPRTGSHHVYAAGLRNPNGMAWRQDDPAPDERRPDARKPDARTLDARKLWVVVNERDELGSDLVPDYITSVTEGGYYGWPYSYYGQHVDERVQPPRPDLVATALPPDYALGPHTASLGLSAAKGNTLSSAYADGMFVGQHGSWNREPLSGYKVVFVPFSGGKPSGLPQDVLTGFVDKDGNAHGRPVGVAVDTRGGLLVADDVGNTVWRVTGSGGPVMSPR